MILARFNWGSNSKKEKTDDPEKKRFHLSDKQKQAIKIGAAAAATALAAYGVYKLGKSGKLNDLADKGREFIGKNFRKELKVGSIDPKAAPKFKMLEKPDSVNEVLRKTNPTGNRNNCFNCVVAATARLCGVDVTARGDRNNGKGISFDEVCKVFKLDPDNPKDIVRMANPSVDRITKQITKRYVDGDVGAIGISWSESYRARNMLSPDFNLGHTLNWTIKNGSVEFFDSQAKMRGKDLMDFLNENLDNTHEASFAKFGNIVKGIKFEADIDLDQFNKFVR